MKRLLATAVVALAMTAPAKADIVLFGLSDVLSFRDVGAAGFGDIQRALTLQSNGIEFGARGFTNTQIDGAINGSNKGNTPTLGDLGWVSGLNVGIGFNTDQAGQHDGITLQALALTVWDLSGAVVFTAHLAQPFINFSALALALQQGNGNAVFDFELDFNERQEFNLMLANNPNNALFTVGLASIIGCGTTSGTIGIQTFNTPGCLVADDGPDSFVLFNQSLAAVPGPTAGAGIPGAIAALFMLGLGKYRRRRNASIA
jgi:hypothetical protein